MTISLLLIAIILFGYRTESAELAKVEKNLFFFQHLLTQRTQSTKTNNTRDIYIKHQT